MEGALIPAPKSQDSELDNYLINPEGYNLDSTNEDSDLDHFLLSPNGLNLFNGLDPEDNPGLDDPG